MIFFPLVKSAAATKFCCSQRQHSSVKSEQAAVKHWHFLCLGLVSLHDDCVNLPF